MNLPGGQGSALDTSLIESFFNSLSGDDLAKFQGPQGLRGLTGPVGPAGPAGSAGTGGDSIWALSPDDIVANNGPLGNTAIQDFVFGDISIEGGNETKIAFEKSTGALRIGATDQGQWLNRGRFSIIMGENSSNTEEDHSVVVGSYNNDTTYTSSVNPTFVAGHANQFVNKQTVIFGSENKTVSGITYTQLYGKDNVANDSSTNSLSNLIVYGNSNKLKDTIPDRTRIFGHYNEINGSNMANGKLSLASIYGDGNEIDYAVSSTNSSSSVFVVGSSNRLNAKTNMVFGRYLENNANNGAIIGSGFDYSNKMVNNLADTMALGYRSKNPAMVITPSLDSVTETGNVAIGNMTPQRKLHISEAMRIEPQSNAPTNPQLGDIYVDDSEAVCVYASGAWAKIAGAGACS